MTVVQADSQDVQPVTVDEFRVAVAETYDVIVAPETDSAYTLFAEAMDRSGYACGTLAPREGLSAPIPEMRPRPLLTMADMGMAHAPMSATSAEAMPGMDHSAMANDKANEMTAMMHGPDDHGPGSDMIAMMPTIGSASPASVSRIRFRRVLPYTDVRSIRPGYDLRAPSRDIELHLTGNMQRFIWSFDGSISNGVSPRMACIDRLVP